MTVTGRHVLAGIVSLIVLAAVVTGVVMLGWPSVERARRLDRRLVEELSGINTSVDSYYSKKGRLPASLDEMWKEMPGVGIPLDIVGDPVPPNAYRYRVLGGEEFELCGTFQRESERRRPGSGVDVWHHPAGEHCFALKVEQRSAK